MPCYWLACGFICRDHFEWIQKYDKTCQKFLDFPSQRLDSDGWISYIDRGRSLPRSG